MAVVLADCYYLQFLLLRADHTQSQSAQVDLLVILEEQVLLHTITQFMPQWEVEAVPPQLEHYLVAVEVPVLAH
jgi:hypothetical protein